MSPHEFLGHQKARWSPLSEKDPAWEGCGEEEITGLRAFEQMTFEGELMALSDIILNCHNRFQFAKTYKVLRADADATCLKFSQPTPNLSPQVAKVMAAIAKNLFRWKLNAMSDWFTRTFADPSDVRQSVASIGKQHPMLQPIEIYAGRPGSSAGCVVLLMVVGCFVSTCLLVGFVG